MTTQGRADAPVLVIVTGPPASGKSTIAAQLAERTRLPLIAKDPIKEILFDTFGWSDRAWSRRLGIATYPVLYELARALLGAGRSLVLEANFDNAYDRVTLLEFPAARLIQVYCTADPEVLITRYERRARSSARHPAHGEMYDEMERRLRGDGFAPLDLPDTPQYVLVTDRFEDVDLAEIESAIGPLSEPVEPLPRVAEETIAERLRDTFGDDDRVGEAARRIASLF